MSKLLATLAFCVAQIAISSVAQAQSSDNSITAGMVTTYPPLEFKDPKTGELSGFNHELLTAMAAKAGLSINWVEDTWVNQASFAPLKTGRVDVATGNMWDTPERRGNGISFVDYLYELSFFYVSADKADSFQDMSNLCGLRVGNIRGSKLMLGTAEKWSEENCVSKGKPPIVQVELANTAEQQLMLRQNRVDAGFTGATSFAQYNKNEGGAFKVIGEHVGEKFFYGFPYLGTNAALGEKLKKGLDEVIADGTYETLLKKWELPADSSIGATGMINAGK